MKSVDRSYNAESGFTLVELITALGLSSIIMAMVVSASLSVRNTFSNDMVRTRVNSNLRSAMDIMAMNIRQTGENLLSYFPAMVLNNGSSSGTSDTLILRRALIPEVLTLCTAASAGSTGLYVSSAGLTDSECVATNVAPTYSVFQGIRLEEGGSIRVYIYDSATKAGEFLTYTSESNSSGQYMLQTSSTSRAYGRLTTAIYFIEEYEFTLNTADKTLVLRENQDSTKLKPVAFDITDFQVTFRTEDNVQLTTLTPLSSDDWKDIQEVEIAISGVGTWKGHTMSSTLTGRYFPRNILSYEG
jgi:prepilin-type N-terminal cleavage/methylation domain-containing protein